MRRNAKLSLTENTEHFRLLESMTFFSTISEQVLNILRDDIIQGALKPGSRLNEQELADRYKVSRTPLREAIR